MRRLSPKPLLAETNTPVSDVLVVNLPPQMVARVSPDLFSHTESARETLALLKLLRFRLLLTTLDVPDMPPWELFRLARRAQAGMQCVLMDERLTPEDERRVRQAGAGAFASSDPALFAASVCPPPTANSSNRSARALPSRAPP
jgi:hypothetical protein